MPTSELLDASVYAVAGAVVATGGLSREIITHCNHSIIYNENLLLEGLCAIYEKNQ